MLILVATDFSPEASEAGRVAADLARSMGATLHFTHVFEPDSIYPLESNELPSIDRAHSLLNREAAIADIPGTTTNVCSGEPVAALIAEVTRVSPSLVVVGACGARGRSSLRELAEKLAQTLPCPVLLVRPVTDRLRYALSHHKRPRVFVAMDRSAASELAVTWLRTLRKHLAFDIIAAHFYDPHVEHYRLGVDGRDAAFVGHPEVVGALERELRQRLDDLGGEGTLTVVCEPRVGSIAVDLLGSARVSNADLIVVGSNRPTALSRLVHGSVSRDVIRHSDVPVICVGVPLQHTNPQPSLESMRP